MRKKKPDKSRTFFLIGNHSVTIPKTYRILIGLNKLNYFRLSLYEIFCITAIIAIILLPIFLATKKDKPNNIDFLQQQRDRIHSEIYE